MIKPAFLVEGDLEQNFIQITCPGVPVQKIGCNGDSVTIEAIAKRVGTLGRLLHKRCSVLIVIFDREQRIETALQIETAFIAALKNEGIQVPVIVGIPDRDIESWILADPEAFAQSARITVPDFTIPIDGTKGKTQIKKLIGTGRSYVETIDGVRWLKSCRASEMKSKSHSFGRFAASLKDLSCWWLNDRQLGSPEN